MRQTLIVFRSVWLMLIVVSFFGNYSGVYALDFETYQFKIEEIERRQLEAHHEAEELKAKLEEMTPEQSTTEARKFYFQQLIEVVADIEKIRKDLEELKKLRTTVEVTPKLKLTQILPHGVPGRYSAETRTGESAPYQIKSVRITDFPLEIVPNKAFTVAGDAFWRERFSARHSCFSESSRGAEFDPRIWMRAGEHEGDFGGGTLAARSAANLSMGLVGKTRLLPFCTDAPTAKDPESGAVLQAEFEKDARVKFSFRFIPSGAEQSEDGLLSYRYRVETSTDGTKKPGKDKGVLLKASLHRMSGSGLCLQGASSLCEKLFIEVHGSASKNGVILGYEQLIAGEPFITGAPTYHHPTSLSSPPFVGGIRLGTSVPDVVGLTQIEAETRLKAAELKMNISGAAPAPGSQLAGRVKSSNPKAGREVKLGATVSVTLYAKTLAVPNVLGISSRKAKEVLTSAGFKSSVEVGDFATRRDKAGIVVRQSPKQGNQSEPNATVTIVIAGPYQETPSEKCAESLPGSVPSPNQNQAGTLVCDCPQGKQWNSDRSRCIQAAPQLTDAQLCARDYPNSVPRRGGDGLLHCDCPAGTIWNGSAMRCDSAPPPLSENEICARALPGSVFSGRRNPDGTLICDCPAGAQWDAYRSGCVVLPYNTPSPQPPLPPPPGPPPGPPGPSLRCPIIMSGLQAAESRGDSAAINQLRMLAQSERCVPAGSGSGDRSRGSGCSIVEGLLGQSDPSMRQCLCNGQPAPMSRCE